MSKDTKIGKKMIGWFLFAVVLIAVYKLLDNFGDITEWIKSFISILMPFIMAVLIAYIFYIPCKKVECIFSKTKLKFIKKRARWFSIFTVYAIAIILIGVIIKFIVPTVYESFVELVTALPGYYNTMIESLKEIPEDSIFNKMNLTAIIDSLSKVNIQDYINLEMLTQYARGIIGFATTIFNIFVTIVVSIYLLAERSQIVNFARRFCLAVFNTNIYKTIGKYFRESNEIFFRFVSSQVLDALIVGILTSIAMSILGVRYAILLGFMIGLFNLIPYLGAIIAIVLAIIITIFTRRNISNSMDGNNSYNTSANRCKYYKSKNNRKFIRNKSNTYNIFSNSYWFIFWNNGNVFSSANSCSN